MAALGPLAMAALVMTVGGACSDTRAVVPEPGADAPKPGTRAVLPQGQPPPDYAALARALGDPVADIAVRMAAAEGLERVAASNEALLIRVLQDTREPLQLRIVTLRALTGARTQGVQPPRRYDAAVSAVVPLIGSEDPVLRLEAARGLGRMGRRGAEGVVAPLRRALRTGDADVRPAAALALGEVGARAASALPDFRTLLFGKAPERELWDALVKIGPPAVPLLVAAAESGSPRRESALMALGNMRHGAKAAIPALRRLSAGGDYLVHSALREIGPPLPELIARLRDPDPEVRRRTLAGMALTARALGEGAAELVPSLRAALADPEAPVRAEVPDIIVLIGAPAADAVPDIVRALRDGDARVRRAAALALGDLAVKVPRPKLVSAARAGLEGARDDPDAEVRSGVEQSLKVVAALPIKARP